MEPFWATSGLDLFVETRWTRRRTSLEDGLRRAIEGGRLAYGTRLPSSRALAKDLGFARGTVTAAYDQLVAEGYLEARPGAGTTVAYRPPDGVRSPPPTSDVETWRYDLRPGIPPVGSFPLDDWLRHQRAALKAAPATAFGYGDAAGSMELRTELAGYLGRARGVETSPSRIVITGGITQALALLGGMFAARGLAVATEDPGFWFHREVLAYAGARILPLPVDRQGADPDALPADGVGAAVVTPSHQYPTGVTLTAARRARLVDWARSVDAYIVEDDYDGELRYDRRAVGALQPAAPDRVVYAGTVSKALGPALRLGWLVLPEALMEDVVRAQTMSLRAVEMTTQLTLARYIRSHGYDQRVRGVRLAYEARYRHLVDAVERLSRAVPGVRLGGISAGGQAPLLLPADGAGEEVVIRAAAAEGIGLEGLSRSSHHPSEHPPGLLLGFSRPPDYLYPAALETLGRVLAESWHR